MSVELNKIILVAVGKLYSEQSTYLLGELKHKPKQRFNQSLISIDAFVKEIESSLSPENFETLELITDAMHDGIANLKKDLCEIKS